MQKYTDNTLFPFGKHKGQKLANVPAEYLLWALDNLELSFPLKTYIEENKAVLQDEIKRSRRFNAR